MANGWRTRAPTPAQIGPAHRLLLAVAIAAVPTALGCELPTNGGRPAVDDSSSSGGEQCAEGATRECHVTVAQDQGVLTCLNGHATCTEGSWGPCEGSISSQQVPGGSDEPSGGAKPLSLSDAGACTTNPCDPTCQVFNEDPDGGVKAVSGDGGVYQGGSISSIPSGFIGKGIIEPCGQALDCQFDEYCSAPVSGTCSHEKCTTGAALASGCDPCVTSICTASPSCCTPSASGTCAHAECTVGAALVNGCNGCVTQICAADPTCCTTSSGTCSHDKCATGAALTSGCDACVTQICAANPSCCTPTFAAACSSGGGHDPCVTGNKLASGCDPCVTAICAANPTCCSGGGSTAWDATCVAAVATTAACGGKTCSPTWSNACVTAVASTCGQTCSPTWSASCVAKATSLCGQSCSPTWGSGCVDKVATVCGAFCDGGPTAGDCTPWAPGGKDPKCAGIDLTVGVPCTGQVPVCNRGNTTAPAGVEVYVYPGNSSHFPKCAPPAGAETAQCTLTQAIGPGQCVDLVDANCVGGNALNGNKTLMVNPTAAVAECHCENNWSDYHNGGCQTTSTATYPSITYEQVYTSSCPSGTNVQWGFFTYDSSTPGDSKITFSAHTAKTVASLPAGVTLLATAKATPAPDTQVCPFASGPPGCPINLYATLGKSAATQPVLELVITLDPTSDKLSAPTLNAWKVTYSCPDSE